MRQLLGKMELHLNFVSIFAIKRNDTISAEDRINQFVFHNDDPV